MPPPLGVLVTDPESCDHMSEAKYSQDVHAGSERRLPIGASTPGLVYSVHEYEHALLRCSRDLLHPSTHFIREAGIDFLNHGHVA